MRDIPEQDWKVFRELHNVWSERFCERILDDVKHELAKPRESKHESYLALYKLVHRHDRKLGEAFNDFRRSTAVMQIAIIRKLGVITEEEIGRFSEETQSMLRFFWGEANE